MAGILNALLLAVTVSDFGNGDPSVLWRSGAAHEACSAVWNGYPQPACEAAELAKLPEGTKVTIIPDKEGVCRSKNAPMVMVLVKAKDAKLPNGSKDMSGCLLRGSVK